MILFLQKLKVKTNQVTYFLSFYVQETQDTLEAGSQLHPAYGLSSVVSVFSAP
jgi:hypothetical protein